MPENVVADIVVVGTGFAGSILAMALQQTGYRVVMLEKSQHPRFTIGESSTPIADMILRDLASEFNLPVLAKLSRYGTWQKHFPHLLCGIKRGFSYYLHQPEQPYQGDSNHSQELLVAASSDDSNSDTNWYRSDTDHFLATEAQKVGVRLFENSEIVRLERNRNNHRWLAVAKRKNRRFTLQANWLIDATGSARFSESFLDLRSSDSSFRTNTSAIFSHFKEVPYWLDALTTSGSAVSDYPYSPDHSALHQVIEEGWIWMLRFNNGLLSSGLVLDHNPVSGRLTGYSQVGQKTSDPQKASADLIWEQTLNRYPSLKALYSGAKLSEVPGKRIATGRLQRRLNSAAGEGWLALPHSAGFVDPLHSTGMAHTLTGVERILNFFKMNSPLLPPDSAESEEFGRRYQETLFSELDLIDELVALCYRTRRNFPLFHSSVMLYFVATIQYERSRLQGRKPESFLCADNRELRKAIRKGANMTDDFLKKKGSQKEAMKTVEAIRKLITPWNSAGLLDPDKKNLYTHTAVTLNTVA